ncbi:unnamed protein product [Heligmosomoides polygyrus]|uniref:Uncharacterized protein n=1 Tax=Heligmosomoides polygyrus TaxID=6339 RepID=A0A183GJH4_HELPZ|nr:unnamed protein product [Heligmosomoides polygyrus]
MCHLDNIIASKKKYEDSTIFNEDYAVDISTPKRGRTRTPLLLQRRVDTISTSVTSAIRQSMKHHSAMLGFHCSFDVDVFVHLRSAIDACAKDTPQPHANADHVNTVELSTTSYCVRIESAGAEDLLRAAVPDRVKTGTFVITVIDRRAGIAIPPEVHPGAEDAPGVRHTIDVIVHACVTPFTLGPLSVMLLKGLS